MKKYVAALLSLVLVSAILVATPKVTRPNCRTNPNLCVLIKHTPTPSPFPPVRQCIPERPCLPGFLGR